MRAAENETELLKEVIVIPHVPVSISLLSNLRLSNVVSKSLQTAASLSDGGKGSFFVESTTNRYFRAHYSTFSAHIRFHL